MSIDWLIASMEKLKPLKADDFKVRKPAFIKARHDPETPGPQGQKRKVDTAFESEHGSSKKLRNELPSDFESGLVIVDSELRIESKKRPRKYCVKMESLLTAFLCVIRETADGVDR